jgi:hypothetical protein
MNDWSYKGFQKKSPIYHKPVSNYSLALKSLASKLTYRFVSKPHLQTWIWDESGTLQDQKAINNKPLRPIKLLIYSVSKPRLQNMNLGWIWDCTRSEAINNKPLRPINISSQSITGVELCYEIVTSWRWVIPIEQRLRKNFSNGFRLHFHNCEFIFRK